MSIELSKMSWISLTCHWLDINFQFHIRPFSLSSCKYATWNLVYSYISWNKLQQFFLETKCTLLTLRRYQTVDIVFFSLKQSTLFHQIFKTNISFLLFASLDSHCIAYVVSGRRTLTWLPVRNLLSQNLETETNVAKVVNWQMQRWKKMNVDELSDLYCPTFNYDWGKWFDWLSWPMKVNQKA